MLKAITLMNILIGIVVEVISNVAIAERRACPPRDCCNHGWMYCAVDCANIDTIRYLYTVRM